MICETGFIICLQTLMLSYSTAPRWRGGWAQTSQFILKNYMCSLYHPCLIFNRWSFRTKSVNPRFTNQLNAARVWTRISVSAQALGNHLSYCERDIRPLFEWDYMPWYYLADVIWPFDHNWECFYCTRTSFVRHSHSKWSGLVELRPTANINNNYKNP